MDHELLVTVIILAMFDVPMFIVGVMMLKGHGASLLAGYNTMSREKQAQWNEKAMLRFMGGVILAFALLLTLCVVAASYGNMVLFWALFAVAMGGLCVALLYLNKSKRFKR